MPKIAPKPSAKKPSSKVRATKPSRGNVVSVNGNVVSVNGNVVSVNGNVFSA